MRNFLLISILILAFLLRLPTLSEPYWHNDEGITLTVGQSIRQGAILYKDIHDNKPPLLYVIAAISDNLFLFKFLTTIAHLATIFFFFKLAQVLLDKRIAIWSTVLFVILGATPILEGNVVNGEIWQLLPLVIALYIFFKYNSPLSLLFTGIFLSLSFLFKQAALFDTLALGLFIFIGNDLRAAFRKIVIIGAGFLIPIATTIAYFVLQGSLSYFVQYGFTENVRYSQAYNNFILPQGLFYIRLTVLTLFIVLFYRLTKTNRTLFFVLTLFTLEVAATFTTGRSYLHYLIGAVPGFSLAVGALALHFRNIKYLKTTLLAFLIIAAYAVNFFMRSSAIQSTISYYTTYFNYKTGKISTNQYFASFDPITTERYLVYNFLKPRVKNNDLLIWGDESLLYPMTHTTPKSGYIASYHVDFYDVYHKVEETIKAHPPKYIVTEKPDKFPFRFFDEFVAEYGNLVFSTKKYNVYEIKK